MLLNKEFNNDKMVLSLIMPYIRGVHCVHCAWCIGISKITYMLYSYETYTKVIPEVSVGLSQKYVGFDIGIEIQTIMKYMKQITYALVMLILVDRPGYIWDLHWSKHIC